MSGVGRVGGATPLARVGARAGAAGSGFTVRPEAGAAGAPPVLASVGIGALDGLLALQETMDAEVTDREARRHGQAMLAALAALQRALLADGGQDEALAHLAGLAATTPLAADPALRAAVGAIALRAQVELAKRAARS